MFNLSIRMLVQKLHQHTLTLNRFNLFKRAISFGLNVSKEHTKQRILFILAQAILILVQNSPTSSGNHCEIDNRTGNEDSPHYEGNRMRESGNDQQYAKLHVAVVLMKEFCSGVTVWDIVDFIGRLRRTLLEECPLLEIIRINNPIEEIKNLKFMYLCHCRRLVEGILEARQKKQSKLRQRCQQCLSSYHPKCQNQVLLCNGCFLKFCFSVRAVREGDPFNIYKQTFCYSFGYVTINPQIDPQNNINKKEIHFYTFSFSVDDYESINTREQKYTFQLRVLSCFPPSLAPDNLKQQSRKQFKLKKYIIDDVQYQFYLNHNKLTHYSLLDTDANCAILRVMSRQLCDRSNILVVKCIVSLPRLEPTQIMLGLYRTLCVAKTDKKHSIRNNMHDTLSLISHERINTIQAQIFIQCHLSAPKTYVSLLDPYRKQPIFIPVRSYACNHLQCFDYDVYKECVQANKKKKLFVERRIRLNTTLAVQRKALRRQQTQLKQPANEAKSRCPICHRYLVALYIDPIFEKILAIAAGKEEYVLISTDGLFQFKQPPSIELD